MKINTLAWSAYSYYNDNKYFIGNIRIAESLPDSRVALQKNGKYVTTGILFDVNSDIIRPESYGVMNRLIINSCIRFLYGGVKIPGNQYVPDKNDPSVELFNLKNKK